MLETEQDFPGDSSKEPFDYKEETPKGISRWGGVGLMELLYIQILW